MPAPLFTTNEGDFTQLEGLYISEKDPPTFVKGINLGKVGIYGTALRGPVDTPLDITSSARFKAIFGTDRHAAGGGQIVSEIYKALLNKKFGPLVITRVAASDAVLASFTLEDTAGGGGTAIARIDASSVGIWGNDVRWKVEDATDGDADHWNLRIRYKANEWLYENLDTSATGNDNISTVISTITTDPTVPIALTKLADGRPNNSVASTDGADADGFTFLGQTVALYTSVAGSDGTITGTDYTASARGLNTLVGYSGVGLVFCANEDGTITAAVNTATKTASATVSDRMFIIHEGELTGSPVVPATVATDAASFRSDRIIYAHNAANTLDPETAQLVKTAPNSWMASILSQTFVDIHPGEEDTRELLSGISSLDSESLTRADYIALRDAGVASLEKDQDGGFLFVSGVTTDLTPGKTEITRRRSADYLQLSVAKAIRAFVKKKNTTEVRGDIGGIITAFLQRLKNRKVIVEKFEVDQESQNTDETRAQGLEFVVMRIRLIGHILHLVLETEIGTGVTIEAA